MKLLILSEMYPSESDPHVYAFVHTRNVGYKHRGNEITIIAFGAPVSYIHEGFEILGRDRRDEWPTAARRADAIVVHAPTLRHHLRFLSAMSGAAIVLVFHGHEVLRVFGDYPDPYPWNKPSADKLIARKAYDSAKLAILPRLVRRIDNRNRLGSVFVSDWLQQRAEENTRLRFGEDLVSIVIPNSVHPVFLETHFDSTAPKDGDFVTIRPLDDSKYAVDQVIAVAAANPHRTFHLFGKGTIFDHVPRPANLTWHDRFLQQLELPNLLNCYGAGFMPTRYDSQGVMACEMASFGMPLLTSDIPVARQMLGWFPNVSFMPVDSQGFLIDHIPSPGSPASNPFRPEIVIAKELAFIREVIESS